MHAAIRDQTVHLLALESVPYTARVERFGLERIQEIARENGKRGGRPKGSGRKQSKKGGN